MILMIWHHHNEEFPIFLDAIVSGSVIDSFNYCIFRELVYLHHIYHTLGRVLNKTLFVVFLSLWAMANDNVYLASRHRRAENYNMTHIMRSAVYQYLQYQFCP